MARNSHRGTLGKLESPIDSPDHTHSSRLLSGQWRLALSPLSPHWLTRSNTRQYMGLAWFLLRRSARWTWSPPRRQLALERSLIVQPCNVARQVCSLGLSLSPTRDISQLQNCFSTVVLCLQSLFSRPFPFGFEHPFHLSPSRLISRDTICSACRNIPLRPRTCQNSQPHGVDNGLPKNWHRNTPPEYIISARWE